MTKCKKLKNCTAKLIDVFFSLSAQSFAANVFLNAYDKENNGTLVTIFGYVIFAVLIIIPMHPFFSDGCKTTL